ncbi:hypothetical protein FRB90_008904 [Tulasnella sp. 427]|nr:hypothetical protein FRB90_008904 [Tulasnella sp. 427]
MQEPNPTVSALGFTTNQLVINIGPDPRLTPYPASSQQPVFIRLPPTAPPDVNPSQSRSTQTPTVPVTIRVTVPKLPGRGNRRYHPVPPTPIEVPQPITPDTSAGSVPKVDLLTPHPTVIPSPFMEPNFPSATGKGSPPIIIRLPSFGRPEIKPGTDPSRVPEFVRATARVPPARPERTETVIRIPDEPTPTPIIIRLQRPLETAREASSPVVHTILRVQAPEARVRTPPQLFARTQQMRQESIPD